MSEPDQHVPTVTELLLARSEDQAPGLLFEDKVWTWSEHITACYAHAAALRGLLRADSPAHIGILADNVPSFSFMLGAAALSGSVLVGLNPTRRGPALAADVRLADCQLVFTENRYAPLLANLDLGPANGQIIEFESPFWSGLMDKHRCAEPTPVPASPDDLLMLIFTSGTSGDPKAVRCTHGKIAFPGDMLARRFGLSANDTSYIAMPLFHSNAIMAGWSVSLASGATMALRRKFSASRFLDDVREFGVTYANYVGKPLSYILQTPERGDDRNNPLRIVYGNEGSDADIINFGKRFDCTVVDAFGSTEGGIGFARTPETPPGSLGRVSEGVDILHPETGFPCPPATFDATGRLTNEESAVGELVNTEGTGWFAGYYRAPEADADRVRNGMYFSGDLAYRDSEGFCYFAGRRGDWLRVDGENLGTAPIERILLRHPDIAEAAVYAITDENVGDQVAAALVPRSGATLDPHEFGSFLDAQCDLGAKQVPRIIRITEKLPRTSTYKVRKRDLAARALGKSEQLWVRDGKRTIFAKRYKIYS